MNFDEPIQDYINRGGLILRDRTLNCTAFLVCDECCLSFHKDKLVLYDDIEIIYSAVKPKCALIREIFLVRNYPELIV